MSASPASSGSSSLGSSCGSCWPSPSRRTASWKPCSSAYRKPVWTAPPIPRLNGSRTTCAPAAAARTAVRSTEPSSTTTTSSPGSKAWISRTTPAIAPSSLCAGTIAMRRSDVWGALERARVESSDADGIPDSDQVEQSPRPVDVRVLVEDALAGAYAHRLGCSRVVEQLAIGLHSLVGAGDDEQLAPGLEPALDALVGIGDDRRTAGGELERPRSRRAGHRRMRPAGGVLGLPRPGELRRGEV